MTKTQGHEITDALNACNGCDAQIETPNEMGYCNDCLAEVIPND